MKKVLAVIFAALCLSFCAMPAFAEEEIPAEDVVSAEEAVSDEVGPDGEVILPVLPDGEIDPDMTVDPADPAEPADPDEAVGSDDVNADVPSDTAGAVDGEIGVGAPEAAGPEAVSSDGTSSLNIIVNYSAGQDDLAGLHLGAIIWSVCGVLLLGCAILFVYKFIQYRNSK